MHDYNETNSDNTLNSSLFSLQNQSINIITNSGYLAHTDVLLKQLTLLKIYDTCKLKVLKLYYKLKHDFLPFQFSSFVPHYQLLVEIIG